MKASHALTGIALIILTLLPARAASGGQDRIDYFSSDISITREADFLWRGVSSVAFMDGDIYLLMVNGLQIYDAGVDMTSPRLISQVQLNRSFSDLYVSGNQVVAYRHDGALANVDMSDFENPKQSGMVELSRALYDYRSAGNAGYAACGFGGVIVLNMVNPDGQPEVVDSVVEAVHAVALEVHDGYLYVVDDYNGICVYEVSEPLNPRYMTTVLSAGSIKDMAVYDDIMYTVTTDSVVTASRIAEPAAFEQLATYSSGTAFRQVVAAESVIGAVDIFGSIFVFDVLSGEVRTVFDERDISDRFSFAELNGREFILLPDASGAMDAMSIDSPVGPDSFWYYPGDKAATGVALTDGFVSVSGAFDDLTAWVLREGQSPQLFDSFGSNSRQTHVTALDPLVLVSEDNYVTGLIHLLASPDTCCALSILKSLISVSEVIDIQAEYNDSGRIDLTSFGPEGTTLMTIELPGAPPEDVYYVLESTFVPSQFNLTAAERKNGYLYTSTSKGGLGIIYDARELGNGLELEEVGRFPVNGRIERIEIRDGYLYMAGAFGLRVYAMDGPQVGDLITERFTEYDFEDLVFDDDNRLVFAALGNDGIAVLDIEDETDPRLLATMDTQGFARQLDVRGNMIAVADWFSVYLFSYAYDKDDQPEALPGSYRLEQNYPNPFNGGTRIDYSVPSSSSSLTHVRIEVFNSLGQLVSTLVDRDVTAGNHTVYWDGRNLSGSQVATGIYFYRLTAGNRSSTKKMLFLK